MHARREEPLPAQREEVGFPGRVPGGGALLLAALLASACATVRPLSGPPVEVPSPPRNVLVTWYEVDADSASGLRRQMDAAGPLDAQGKRHDAYTSWYVTWEYPFSRDDAGCTTGPVTTSVRVTYTLPRWKTREAAEYGLQLRWRGYFEALLSHEAGHRATGLDAAREIEEVLPRLPPAPTCEEAEKAANDAGHRILGQHRIEDTDYDAETRHGATQGAVFP